MAPRLPRFRILIIDGRPNFAELDALLSDLSGHYVETAFSDEAAVEKASRIRPDLIVCHVGRPGVDSATICRRIRMDARRRKPLVIALAEYDQPLDEMGWTSAGFDICLNKPRWRTDYDLLLAELDRQRNRPCDKSHLNVNARSVDTARPRSARAIQLAHSATDE
ncbi:MAG: hypothetical protein ABI612_11305 [Betaproteobacteria bacterium]